MNRVLLFLPLVFFASPAYAYIGPGMGGGLIAAVIGFVAAILLGFFAILYFPIKRALKNKKNKNKTDIKT